jgi:hypothetical protein
MEAILKNDARRALYGWTTAPDNATDQLEVERLLSSDA